MFSVLSLGPKHIFIMSFLILQGAAAIQTKTEYIKPRDPSEVFGILTLPVSVDYVPQLTDILLNKGLPKDRIDNLLSEMNEMDYYYVPFLNLQGKLSVPLLFTDPQDMMVSLLDELDGVLLTGGDTLFALKPFKRDGQDFFSVDIQTSGPYLPKVKAILDKVKSINSAERYFPLFAVCLGFEAIQLVESDYKFSIADVIQNNETKEVYFTEARTRLKSNFNNQDVADLQNNEDMFFYHSLGFLPKDFQSFPALNENYTIVAHNQTDRHGIEIAAFEHKTLPIFATQFHPEKTLFDYSSAYKINHSDEAKRLAYKFGSVLYKEKSLMSSSGRHKPNTLVGGTYYIVLVRNIGEDSEVYFVSRNKEILLLGEEVKI